MADKVGLLLGCNFTPTNTDCQNAYEQGHLANVDQVRAAILTGGTSQTEATKAYLQLISQKGWAQPIQISAKKIVSENGGDMWAICGEDYY